MNPEIYKGRTNGVDGADYRTDGDKIFSTIRVLLELKGKPWDEISLAYVSALRPSRIRVLNAGDAIQLDFRSWRVTVCIEKSGLIDHVFQEVSLDCPPGIHNGEQLDWALRRGINSPQAQWFSDMAGSHYNGIKDDPHFGYWKTTTAGEWVKFPDVDPKPKTPAAVD